MLILVKCHVIKQNPLNKNNAASDTSSCSREEDCLTLGLGLESTSCPCGQVRRWILLDFPFFNQQLFTN